MGKQAERHPTPLQRFDTTGVAEDSQHATGIAVSEDAVREIEAPQERWGKADTAGCFDERTIDIVRQRGQRDGFIRIWRMEQVRGPLTKGKLHFGSNPMSVRPRARDIGEQKHHPHIRSDRIEEIASPPIGMVTGAEIHTRQTAKVHWGRSSPRAGLRPVVRLCQGGNHPALCLTAIIVLVCEEILRLKAASLRLACGHQES